MSHVYVSQSVADLRECAEGNSRVVSQAIFAEKVQIEKEYFDWAFVSTLDNYRGWIRLESLIKLARPYEGSLAINRVKAHVYGVKDIEFGPVKTLPFGSQLILVEEMDDRWLKVMLLDGKEAYIQRGDVTIQSRLSHKRELLELSHIFLNLPYTWGGRSSFGFDCSGFVQMLYGRLGIFLERDSKQQVLDQRFQTISMIQSEAGDLIFFGKNSERIMHVGIYLGDGRMIHATSRENKPWLRISPLSDFEWSGHDDAHYPYRVFRQLKI